MVQGSWFMVQGSPSLQPRRRSPERAAEGRRAPLVPPLQAVPHLVRHPERIQLLPRFDLSRHWRQIFLRLDFFRAEAPVRMSERAAPRQQRREEPAARPPRPIQCPSYERSKPTCSSLYLASLYRSARSPGTSPAVSPPGDLGASRVLPVPVFFCLQEQVFDPDRKPGRILYLSLRRTHSDLAELTVSPQRQAAGE